MKENKPVPSYCATEIATQFGHLVYFTPPYHPELQPIELIWAQVKNGIAASPATTMKELGDKLTCGFAKVTSSYWIKAYKHVQKYEEGYVQQDDECPLAADDEDQDVGEDEDTIIDNYTIQYSAIV